jgi:hypothetical protein
MIIDAEGQPLESVGTLMRCNKVVIDVDITTACVPRPH